MAGKLYNKQTMFLRMSGGKEYEMTSNVGDGSPIIMSKTTGKYWVIGWKELLMMAVEAGIDDEDKNG